MSMATMEKAAEAKEAAERHHRQIKDQVDREIMKMRKELRSKVKARAFKALHIGVPVTFIR